MDRKDSMDEFVAAASRGIAATKALKVELKIDSLADLRNTMAIIEAEITNRRTVDINKIRFHFEHIAHQPSVEVANTIEYRRISLEHLEL